MPCGRGQRQRKTVEKRMKLFCLIRRIACNLLPDVKRKGEQSQTRLETVYPDLGRQARKGVVRTNIVQPAVVCAVRK